ncbi:MAG: DNA repair protein RecO [bacterium]|nr:DNA repair protein RecO [bacterium]
MDYKYTGIILGKKDVGETDRIYSIYTLESGKIRVLAKGVRKANAKLAGFLENFTLAEIFIAKNQGMGKITGSLVLNTFSGIKNNLEAIRSVFESVEILSKLLKEDNHDQKVFQLLREYLETTNQLADEKNQDKVDVISQGFLFRLFDELGYKIEIGRCTACGERLKESDNFFDCEQGGVICASCSSKISGKIKINLNSIKIIRIFFQNSLKSLAKLRAEKKDLDNLKLISREFLKWIV